MRSRYTIRGSGARYHVNTVEMGVTGAIEILNTTYTSTRAEQNHLWIVKEFNIAL